MFIWGEKEGKNEKELKEPALMQQFPTTEFRTELDLFTHKKNIEIVQSCNKYI